VDGVFQRSQGPGHSQKGSPGGEAKSTVRKKGRAMKSQVRQGEKLRASVGRVFNVSWKDTSWIKGTPWKEGD